MFDYSELIDQLERLPVNEVTRSIARVEFVTPQDDRVVARAFAYLKQLAGWARRASLTARKSNSFLGA